MIDAKSIICLTSEKANSLTNSVLTLARLMKVEPLKLAEALLDDTAEALYRAEITAELLRKATAKAVEEANKPKA